MKNITELLGCYRWLHISAHLVATYFIHDECGKPEISRDEIVQQSSFKECVFFIVNLVKKWFIQFQKLYLMWWDGGNRNLLVQFLGAYIRVKS